MGSHSVICHPAEVTFSPGTRYRDAAVTVILVFIVSYLVYALPLLLGRIACMRSIDAAYAVCCYRCRTPRGLSDATAPNVVAAELQTACSAVQAVKGQKALSEQCYYYTVPVLTLRAFYPAPLQR